MYQTGCGFGQKVVSYERKGTAIQQTKALTSLQKIALRPTRAASILIIFILIVVVVCLHHHHFFFFIIILRCLHRRQSPSLCIGRDRQIDIKTT